MTYPVECPHGWDVCPECDFGGKVNPNHPDLLEVRCSWCERVIREAAPGANPKKITHTICLNCERRITQALEDSF